MSEGKVARPVTDSDFAKQVLEAKELVLVDFWADWCAPCHALAPMLEELAVKYQGKVTVLKLDADENPEAASKYGVRGLPTVMLFKNGEAVDRLVGVQPKDRFVDMLTRNGA